MNSASANAIIKAVLLDLSGNVHVGSEIIPGALEAVQKLVDHNIAVKFVTNTTKKSRKETLTELWAMGFSKDLVHSENVVTTTQASSQLIQKQKLTPYCLIQQSLLEDLEMQSLPEMQDCNSVLVGLAPEAFEYNRLNAAFRVIMTEKERRRNENIDKRKSQPPLVIALHRGKYLRDVDGGLSLGPGGFVACLQEAAGLSDSDIAVMGKPSPEFFRAAIPEGTSPEETAMVGDDVRQDVLGAKQAGLGLGILVKTGKYQKGDELVQDEYGHSPDATVDSIAEAVDLILDRNKGKACN